MSDTPTEFGCWPAVLMALFAWAVVLGLAALIYLAVFG